MGRGSNYADIGWKEERGVSSVMYRNIVTAGCFNFLNIKKKIKDNLFCSPKDKMRR